MEAALRTEGQAGKGGWVGKGGPRPNRPTREDFKTDGMGQKEGAANPLLRADDDQEIRHNKPTGEGRRGRPRGTGRWPWHKDGARVTQVVGWGWGERAVRLKAQDR